MYCTEPEIEKNNDKFKNKSYIAQKKWCHVIVHKNVSFVFKYLLSKMC